MFFKKKNNKCILGILNNMELYFNDATHYTNIANLKLNHIAKTIHYFVDNLRENSEKILNILNTYSKQNSINVIDINHLSGYFKSLRIEVNSLQETITQMLTENKQNELALEEISSVLQDVTNNIFKNTKKIIKMVHLAETVTKASALGKALTNETTIAMNEIDEEVNSIIKAITIIDKIAFQTNILSLNAAVEATTVEEARKEFAVVDTEKEILYNIKVSKYE